MIDLAVGTDNIKAAGYTWANTSREVVRESLGSIFSGAFLLILWFSVDWYIAEIDGKDK